MISRRALLSVAGAAGLAAAPPPRARLRPDMSSTLAFSPLPGERLAFAASGLPGMIVMPVGRAALLGALPLVSGDVAVVNFANDPEAPPGRLDYAAIIGWDGAALRILALEARAWQAEPRPPAPFGPRLTTRMSATADRASLLLSRDAAAPRRNGAVQRESWTDRLERREDGTLADAPTRPPQPGTWQQKSARDRAALAAKLASACDVITPELLALCRPPDLAVRD